MKWHILKNKRSMPWKGITDPYKIWLSEIILQQTRVEQGINFYNSLTNNFPTVEILAAAPDDKVYRLWQGLGYYNRCKNMIETAKYIASKLNGVFPKTYKEVLALKGVGNYTAAAICSFAYNMPYAVVDGNVVRVLSRVFGLENDFYTLNGKKEFDRMAQILLDKQTPALYNQAIMDFGATICLPKNPICSNCIFKRKCIAFNEHKIAELPVKKKKIELKKRFFLYVIYATPTEVLIKKRAQNDIWQNLYEFAFEEVNSIHVNPTLKMKGRLANLEPEIYVQTLSHQRITAIFYLINVSNKFKKELPTFIWVKKKNLKEYPFPKMIVSYLKKNNYL